MAQDEKVHQEHLNVPEIQNQLPGLVLVWHLYAVWVLEQVT